MSALFHVTAWERISIWRRLLCGLGRVTLVLVLLIVVLNLFGPPIGMFLTARWEARKVPAINVAPQPLRDYTVSSAPGTVLSYFGYQFDAPWNRAAEKRVGKSLVHLQFDSGLNLLLFVPSDQSGLLASIVKDPSSGMQGLRPVLGNLIEASPYDQYAALLNTTPHSVSVFDSRREAVRKSTLLTLKAIAVGPALQTGASSFELTDKRGFILGDPSRAKQLQLEVFGREGYYVEMVLVSSENHRPSQPEINRILTTLHRSATSSGTLE